MVRIIILLLLLTLIAAWVWFLIRGSKKRIEKEVPVGDLNKDADPIEAAAALMIGVARMDSLVSGPGKLSGAQSRQIREELQNKMELTPGKASILLERVRAMFRHYNRAQSVLPAVAPALKNALTDNEIKELVGMLTRVAECDGPINRDQMEFIADVRDNLDKLGTGWHLAQVNIASFRAPKFNTANDDFHNAIDRVNAVAEGTPGFVWRLVDDSAERPGVDMFRDPDMLVNLSVWADLESLSAFVYRDKSHREIMRRRDEWFDELEIHMALWWVKAGDYPSLQEAADKLDLLAGQGPSSDAFTFKTPFPPPDK